ncbi:MAG TPA: Crp/Fnr family transcriptional regulator [Nevskiaceae bacterium]|nr:Crp/Fnr family transcriptional regulator [Nevskiaceae bacterium]
MYDVFAAMPPGARRTLDSRTLYRQWKETRLRRDDLASAIRTLVSADLLRYEWVNGECVFSLARGANKRPLRVLRAAIPRAAATDTETSSPLLRRREDRVPATHGGERDLPLRSRLLNSLPVADREKLYRSIELVPLRANTLLCERNGTLRHVYFPLDAIISCELELGEGTVIEALAVANGGAAGFPVLGGDGRSPFRLLVAHGGYAHRLPVAALLDAVAQGGAIERLVRHHEHVQLQQVAWRAACNRHHTIEQQVCRLLLFRATGSGASRLEITHEAIARALGVRREGVTQVLGRLQVRGLVACERGSIVLRHPVALEPLACECHGAVQQLHEPVGGEHLAAVREA